jgi:hypothetical protein
VEVSLPGLKMLQLHDVGLFVVRSVNVTINPFIPMYVDREKRALGMLGIGSETPPVVQVFPPNIIPTYRVYLDMFPRPCHNAFWMSNEMLCRSK